MVRNRQLFFLTILVAIVFSACQEKEPLTENPVVITGNAITGDKNVINFTGSFLSSGNTSSIDYGFVWSSKTSSPSISDYKFRFKKKPSKGIFEAKVDYDLLGDSVSYVRAFVETREAVIYGEVREFHAKSSLSPRIISISPKETTGNDTITIFGEYLTSKISDISIQYTFERFAGNWPAAKIVYADGKNIRFVLSNTPLTTSNNIYLSIKIRDKDIFPDSKINPPLYANVGPQIVGFYPPKVAKNGIVKIKVKNMVGTPDHLTLYSKEYASYQEIDGIEGDSIRIKLDDYIRYGNHRLMLVTINKGVTYTCYSKDSLEVRHPEITGIEENSPSAGDSVTINGRYFTPKFAFYVTNEACPYQHYSEFRFINSRKIRLALSDAIFDGSNQMCINTYDGFVSKFPVQIRSRWTVKSKFPESHRYAICVQSGGRLVFGNWVSNFSSSKDIYIYNIASNSMDKINQPSDMAVYQFVIAKDDDIYMFRKYYANLSEPVPDSYSFNLKNQEWKKVESVKMISGYSFIDQYSTCFFGGKFYFKQNTNTEVYAYDLIRNAWSYKNSIPIADVNMSFMVEKSAALYFYYVRYYYSGMDRSMVSSFKYNETQNLWEPEADFGSIPGQISSVFVDGNYFWFGSSGRLYKYSSDGKLVSSVSASYPVSQFYNNKFYGVVTYSDSFNCIVEFDPNKY